MTSYREKITYPIKLTVDTVKKLIWDIDRYRFGGEVKSKIYRKITVVFHIGCLESSILPYYLNSRGVTPDDGYLPIGVCFGPKKTEYYKNIYHITNDIDFMFCLCEDILLEIALIAYGLKKNPNREVILDCSRESLYNRKANRADIALDEDVWNVISNNLNYKDIGGIVAKLNKNIRDIAKRELKERAALRNIKKSVLRGKCNLENFITEYQKYPQDVNIAFIRDVIHKQKCPHIINYIKENNPELVEKSILSMERYEADHYIYIREFMDRDEAVSITYKYVRNYAKRHKKKIEDVKKELGFVGLFNVV